MDDKRKFSQQEEIEVVVVSEGANHSGWNRVMVVDGLWILPSRSIQGHLTTFRSLCRELVHWLPRQNSPRHVAKTSSTMKWPRELILYHHSISISSYYPDLNNAIVLSWTGSFLIFQRTIPFLWSQCKKASPGVRRKHFGTRGSIPGHLNKNLFIVYDSLELILWKDVGVFWLQGFSF